MGKKKEPFVVRGSRWSYVDGKRIDHPDGKVFIYEVKEEEGTDTKEEKPSAKKRRKSA
jgi:hypothetical protein